MTGPEEASARDSIPGQSPPARSRCGISLAEVMVAALILALLGVSIGQVVVSSLRGIQVDRLAEAKRNLTLDLLERFCHPYSDLDALFAEDAKGTAERELTVEEAIGFVGLPTREGQTLREILSSGGVTGFTLVWKRIGAGDGNNGQALTMQVLACTAKVSQAQQGPTVRSFRVFTVRGVVS